MNNLIVCFNAVAPQFLMLAGGYLSRRFGLLSDKNVPVLTTVSYKLLIFFQVFNGMISADLATALRPGLMLFMALGMAGGALVAIPVMRRLEPDPRSRGVLVDSVFHVNYIIMAMPIVTSLMGSAGGAVAAAMSVVVIPTENILAVVVLTRYNGGKVSLKEIILDIFKNPLVLGCLAGFAVLLLRLELPQFLLSTCSQLAAACTPICLLGLGATIRFQGVHQSLHRILIAVAARLVVVPAVLISLAVALGFRGTDLAVITVGFSSSVAATAFPLCQQLGGDSKLIANIVVFTSVLACFAIFLYTFLLKELGLI